MSSWAPVHLVRSDGCELLLVARSTLHVASPTAVALPARHTDVVRSAYLSADAPYAVTGGDDKRVVLWERTQPWAWRGTVLLDKKVSAVALAHTDADGWHVLVGDKFGHCYALPVANFTTELPEARLPDLAPLLGHYASIMALAPVPSASHTAYVLTGDRDEKLRVSHYPTAYDIRAYCLGQRAFTTCLAVLSPDLALSGTRDGTMALWDLARGTLLASSILASAAVLDLVCIESDSSWLIVVAVDGVAELPILQLSCVDSYWRMEELRRLPLGSAPLSVGTALCKSHVIAALDSGRVVTIAIRDVPILCSCSAVTSPPVVDAPSETKAAVLEQILLPVRFAKPPLPTPHEEGPVAKRARTGEADTA